MDLYWSSILYRSHLRLWLREKMIKKKQNTILCVFCLFVSFTLTSRNLHMKRQKTNES